MKLQIRLLLYFLFVGLSSVVLTATLTALITPLILIVEEEDTLLSSSDIDVTVEERIQRPVNHQVNQAALFAGLIVAAGATGLSWQVSRHITKPIVKIVEATRHIADGHYDIQIDIQQKDELGSLVDHFNAMAQAMSAIEATRQQLIADVSHELKTPLTAVKGMMEGFEDGVIPQTPENFQLIYHEIDRLQRLTADLQELSITASGALHLYPAWHLPDEIVSGVIKKLASQYATKNIRLTTDIAAPLPQVYVDRERLEQVLINIMGNSLQYTHNGGHIHLRINSHKDSLSFEIQDNGIGLEYDDLKKIFQRFYRVDKSRARVTGGSGIGLTIARNIVEAHHGRIWATSPGSQQGTTIHIKIPVNALL